MVSTQTMADYAIVKTNKESGEVRFLAHNAAGTKTFKPDFKLAWTNKDHRAASNMLDMCVAKHGDTDKFSYSVDDFGEVGEW